MIEIKYDEKKLKEIENTLSNFPKKIPMAMSRAVNRTATMTRTEIIKRLQEKLNLKKKDITQGITFRKANWQRWMAEMGLHTKPIPILDFAARQGKKKKKQSYRPPVTYQILKSGGRLVLPGAFITGVETGHEGTKHIGVFERESKFRLPIREVFGPSLGEAFEDTPELVRSVTEKAADLLNKQVDDQVRMLFEKRGVRF